MTNLTSSDFIIFKSGNRVAKVLYGGFGSLLCLLGILILMVTCNDFAAFVPAFLVITLPCCGFGTYFLITLRRLLKASVIVCPDWIEFNVPDFRAGWLFKGVAVRLQWEEIEYVTHDRYAIMDGAKPIDIYSIVTTVGVFTLTKDVCKDAAVVANLISERIQSTCYELVVEEAQETDGKTPEQEEAELKNKAILALVILFTSIWVILVFVLAETSFMRLVMRWAEVIDNILLVVAIVSMLIGIFRLWLNSKRNRAIMSQKIKTAE